MVLDIDPLGLTLFPSPQGGSETERAKRGDEDASVSIPSRRVGDQRAPRLSAGGFTLFPSPQGGSETTSRTEVNNFSCRSFHPLKAGRRQPNRLPYRPRKGCFHPLKAGRRLPLWKSGERFCHAFPSPQGGSETGANGRWRRRCGGFHPLKAGRRPRENEGKGGQKKAKGREGCRRPSVGGKS